MIKKIFLSSVICFFLAFVFFHQTFFSLGSELAIKLYSYYQWGEFLAYEKMHVDGNKIIIDHALLKNKRFSADHLEITYDMNWWTRQLNLAIKLQKPVWHLMPIAPTEKKWKSLISRKKKPWFNVDFNCHAEEGHLKWTLNDQIERSLDFNLDLDSSSGGALKVFMDGLGTNVNHFTIQAISQKEGMAIQWDCQHTQCADIIKLAALVYPELQQWDIQSGFAVGQMRAIFSDVERPYLEGSLTLNDLIFFQPEINVTGKIKKSILYLEKNLELFSDNDLTTLGKIDVLEGASFISEKNNKIEWELGNIFGSVKINSLKHAFIDLQSIGVYRDQSCHFKMNGEVNLNAQHPFHMTFNVLVASSNHAESYVKLMIHQPVGLSKIAEIECQKLKPIEFGFIQTVLSTYKPELKAIQFHQGVIDAKAQIALSRQGIESIACPFLYAENLSFSVIPWQMDFSFPKWTANGSINLKSDQIWDTFNTELHVENGQICFESLKRCPLSDIQAHIQINQGRVYHSLVKSKMAGLKGVMDIEWGDGKKLFTATMQGKTVDLAEVLPDMLQKGIKKQFPDNQIGVTVNVKGHPSEINMEGVVRLERDAQTNEMDLIHFGYELKKDPTNPNVVAAPSGWFYAKNLPLQKYLSPYVFRNGIAEVKGFGEFSGTYNPEKIVLKYMAHDLKIENKDFLINIGELPKQPGQEYPGIHTFNLQTGLNEGSFPMQGASYLEKNTGLLFDEIQAVTQFKDPLIYLDPFEAHYQGITFGGQVLLDNTDPAPGVFALAFSLPTFHGQLEKVREIMSHLKNPPSLSKLPFDGNIEAVEKGLNVRFDFIPKDFLVTSQFTGLITHGSLPMPIMQMSFQDLTMNVSYLHEKESLNFTDIQGTLLLGKPSKTKEFIFSGDHIHLQNLKQQLIDMDVEISEQGKSFGRLVGKTEIDDDGKLNIKFNHSLTHLFEVHPSTFELKFHDWSNIQSFTLDAPFTLDKSWSYFQKTILETGLFFPTPISDKFLTWKDSKGQFLLSMHYDEQDNDFTYSLVGDQVSFNQAPAGAMVLKGKKQDSNWTIDPFTFGRWKVFANLKHQEDAWKINSFVLNYGDIASVGLEGSFKNGVFDSTIQLFEADLVDLKNLEDFKPFVEQWNPKGVIKGKGNFKVESLEHAPWYQVDANLIARMDDLRLNEFPFHVDEPFKILFKPDRSIELQDLTTHIINYSGIAEASLLVKRLYYQAQNDLFGTQVNFELPHESLEQLGVKLHRFFPNLIDPAVIDKIKSIKQDGPLKGSIVYEKNNDTRLLQFGLEEGDYLFKHKNYYLKDFFLNIGADKITFSGFSRHERALFKMEGTVALPNLDHGLLVLNDNWQNNQIQPLAIVWKDTPEQGFQVESAHGYFSGLNVSLNSVKDISKPHWSVFNGEIGIDFKGLSPFLAQSTAEKIADMTLGSNYFVKGMFWLNENENAEFIDSLFFEGDLTGRNIMLKGYLVDKLDAKLNYSPRQLDVKDMTFSDPAGALYCSDMTVNCPTPKGDWFFSMPSLEVKDFQPSLLREEGESSASTNFKSLLIRRIELVNGTGNLSESTTWNANGILQFSNSTRKSQHPLLAIPGEIILRLGLDPNVLNPVTGTIYFNLENDRFYLSKFKDVYSEGRGSKFYLANTTQPSWMDLKGNLFVQIRMKQYNLLFKLAELFTVSVQGTVKNPTYSLQRHEKNISSKLQSMME